MAYQLCGSLAYPSRPCTDDVRIIRFLDKMDGSDVFYLKGGSDNGRASRFFEVEKFFQYLIFHPQLDSSFS